MVWHTILMWSRMIKLPFWYRWCTFFRRMACKYKKCARWCKTRLSDHSTYGTWSLRKYWHIYGELSRYHNCGKRESIYHHEAILWMWLCRAPACSQRKRHTGTWKTYTYICCSTYGSLARSHYDLRFLCKSILQLQMHLENSVHWMLRKTGLAKQGRYYFGIVGKFGAQVQALLKKAAGLDIQTICPLHGPVLNENLDFYRNLYQTWSALWAGR